MGNSTAVRVAAQQPDTGEICEGLWWRVDAHGQKVLHCGREVIGAVSPNVWRGARRLPFSAHTHGGGYRVGRFVTEREALAFVEASAALFQEHSDFGRLSTARNPPPPAAPAHRRAQPHASVHLLKWQD